MINEKLQNLAKEYEQPNRIIAFKGVKIENIPTALLDRFVDKNVIGPSKLKDQDFFNTDAQRTLLLGLMDKSSAARYITYESLVFAMSLVNPDLISDEIMVLDFSVHGYHYNNFSSFNQNIEDLAESEEEIDLEAYDKVVVSSMAVNNRLYIQFADGLILQRCTVVSIYESTAWEYKSLPLLNENEIVPEDLVYNYEDKLFVPFVEDVVDGKIERVRLLVDNETVQDQQAIDQLGYILTLLADFEVSYELLRIKHDLGRAVRPELQDLLKKHWGSDKFRSLKVYADPDVDKTIIEISQAEVVETIIEQYENGNIHSKEIQDVFLTAPTGAGKSLLFQMPAIYLGDKYQTLSIVVSPLKALMVDQVRQLRQERGYVKVAYINSDITVIEREEIIEDITQGEIDLLYMAPELLLSYDISYFLNGRKLGLYVVDEAHTVSTWGRDFRIDYWYLGYHINRVRKYARDADDNELKFPVVAVTATAPYGQRHDVVFETLTSLQMKAPIKYIGYARRDDITFEINRVQITGNLQTQKVNLTANRIEAFEKEGDKTIVYCPFTTQVTALERATSSRNLNTHPYHGSMNVNDQNNSYDHFKNDSSVTMVATKAFGMGVDINNVSRVHHLAPTGLLTDYIQEIGRAARDQDIEGIASLDYSDRDFQFINQLHGLSRMHNWQLREVMRRLIRIYDETGEQNQLISAEDFAYIFQADDEDKLQGEVKKALLLIEKDLNQKFSRIPVIIARPKNMFSTVYASISEDEIDLLSREINRDYFTIINYMPLAEKGRKILRIELDRVWESNFRDSAFGVIKRKYFKEELFENISLQPKLKIDITLIHRLPKILSELNIIFSRLERAFFTLEGFFTKKDFALKLGLVGFDVTDVNRIAEFILPMFSQRARKQSEMLQVDDVREQSNFLQARREAGTTEMKYRVVDKAFGKLKTNLRRSISQNFKSRKHITKYVSKESGHKYLYIKIGQLLEIFELGNYEVTGGENPRIYVRINDPFRLRAEAFSNYENTLLNDVAERHVNGVALMREFFDSELTSDDRWEFIEDFLLGFRV
jgi:RecQ family ATP-dependent DNA helicase